MSDLTDLAYIFFLALAIGILIAVFRTPRRDYSSPEDKDIAGYRAVETLKRAGKK